MSWQHLKAIFWLRWRLSVNQWKRGGSLNAVIGLFVLVFALCTAISSFFISFLIGVFILPKATPDQLLLVWDAIVVVFLFMWIAGLVTELQRSEPVSLDKLLHLPISLSGTFLLNYISSTVSLSLILFVPTTMGLTFALIMVKGPAMLVLFALLVTFVLMVTAITHQFRGWLQVLMVNKRRRRTIIAVVTGVFILIVQIPNLVNITWQRSHRKEGTSQHQVAVQELQQELNQGEIDAKQYGDRFAELKRDRSKKQSEERKRLYGKVIEIANVANVIVPIGWLPYGARSAAAGSLWPGLLGSLGALAIGAASLWRSYRTTLRIYTGGFQSGAAKKKQVAEVRSTRPAANFLEREISRIPPGAATVALCSFRSLMRSPEGKMLLLTPFMLLGFFGLMIFAGRDRNIHAMLRPVLGLGTISVTMLCFMQLLCNAFAFDRDGFRALVLSPCRRQDILLGKNLAVLPLAVGVGCVAIVVLQILVPMTVAHAAATVVQVLGAFLAYCVLGNFVSMIAPSPVKVGSLNPGKTNFVRVMIHLGVAMATPVALVPAFAALGVEFLLDEFGLRGPVPVYLLLSVAELAVAIWLYRRLLAMQGRVLQKREQAILEIVTTKGD